MQRNASQVRITGARQVAKEGRKTQACIAPYTGARIALFFLSLYSSIRSERDIGTAYTARAENIGLQFERRDNGNSH